MQRLGWECLFGVLHSVMSLSLIYPLCDAYLAPIFSTYTHIHTPLWSNKDAGTPLTDIVIKSGLNSRISEYRPNNELASHSRRNVEIKVKLFSHIMSVSEAQKKHNKRNSESYMSECVFLSQE